METMLDFARGPLFRFSLAIMLLGLLRILLLDLVAAVAAVDPHMAAKPAQASTVAMVRPPRRLPTHV